MQRRRPCRFSAGHAQAARRSTRCTRCQTQADRDLADGVAPGKPGEPMSGEPTWDRTNWRSQLCSQGYRARELPFRAALCCVARPLTYHQPIVDLRAFTNRNFALGSFYTFVVGTGMYGTTYLIPLFLAQVRG